MVLLPSKEGVEKERRKLKCRHKKSENENMNVIFSCNYANEMCMHENGGDILVSY